MTHIATLNQQITKQSVFEKKIYKENLRILEKHVKQDWAKKNLQTKLQQIIIKKKNV